MSELFGVDRPSVRTNPNTFFDKIRQIGEITGKNFTKKDGSVDIKKFKDGGIAEATAKLKAKGMKEGGMVVKDKIVAIDTSPNSGLITVKGFGAGRRTQCL